MILLIDNYDSFSYNLYQLVGSICPDIRVVRNDQVTVEDIRAMAPSHLLLSPGPGRPTRRVSARRRCAAWRERSLSWASAWATRPSARPWGAGSSTPARLMHGKQSQVALDESCPLFQGLPGEIPAARYHSLAVAEDSLPDCLKAVARTQDGEVMAVAHRDCPVYGLQFHPESILTPDGGTILKNFLEGN